MSLLVRLYLAGDEPEFEAVLDAMSAAYKALVGVQREVLGEQAERLHWTVVALHNSSAVVDLEAAPDPGMDEAMIERVVDRFVEDVYRLAVTPEHVPPDIGPEVLTHLRDLSVRAARGGLDGFTTMRIRTPQETQPVADLPRLRGLLPSAVEEPPAPRVAVPASYMGTLIGRIDALNRHDDRRRRATMYEEVHGARVTLTYPRELHREILDALAEEGQGLRGARRVEVTGEVFEDDDGRPTQMRVVDLDVIPRDEDLPSLFSLLGSMPGLTRGEDPVSWVDREREQGGLFGR